MCNLQEQHDELERDRDLLKDKLEETKDYADELADELAKFNQPVPAAPQPEGRHFRV